MIGHTADSLLTISDGRRATCQVMSSFSVGVLLPPARKAKSGLSRVPSGIFRKASPARKAKTGLSRMHSGVLQLARFEQVAFG